MHPESGIQFFSHPLEAYVCPSRRPSWFVVVVRPSSSVRRRPKLVGWIKLYPNQPTPTQKENKEKAKAKAKQTTNQTDRKKQTKREREEGGGRSTHALCAYVELHRLVNRPLSQMV
jgi:hypothetical protein